MNSTTGGFITILPRVFLDAFAKQYLDVEQDIGTDIGGRMKVDLRSEKQSFKPVVYLAKGEAVLVSANQDASGKTFLKVIKGVPPNCTTHILHLK